MKIEVLHPGFSTTVQDSGRINGLAYGVPKGGAMDVKLMHLANQIVGNTITNPVLEFTMLGGKYRFSEDAIIAIAGQGIVYINSNQVETNSKLYIRKNDVLYVNAGPEGRYNYLAIQGRIEAEEFWGSFSTYEFVEKGGHLGRKLEKRDVLGVRKGLENKFEFSIDHLKRSKIRILKAPEFDCFPKKDIISLVDTNFTVSAHSNRMGYRLCEPALVGTPTGNIISSGCVPGTIQVPSSGEPIVLMADSPTTGGYPRIAVIHPDDFGCFAQKTPGEIVNFEWFEI